MKINIKLSLTKGNIKIKIICVIKYQKTFKKIDKFGNLGWYFLDYIVLYYMYNIRKK